MNYLVTAVIFYLKLIFCDGFTLNSIWDKADDKFKMGGQDIMSSGSMINQQENEVPGPKDYITYRGIAKAYSSPVPMHVRFRYQNYTKRSFAKGHGFQFQFGTEEMALNPDGSIIANQDDIQQEPKIKQEDLVYHDPEEINDDHIILSSPTQETLKKFEPYRKILPPENKYDIKDARADSQFQEKGVLINRHTKGHLQRNDVDSVSRNIRYFIKQSGIKITTTPPIQKITDNRHYFIQSDTSETRKKREIPEPPKLPSFDLRSLPKYIKNILVKDNDLHKLENMEDAIGNELTKLQRLIEILGDHTEKPVKRSYGMILNGDQGYVWNDLNKENVVYKINNNTDENSNEVNKDDTPTTPTSIENNPTSDPNSEQSNDLSTESSKTVHSSYKQIKQIIKDLLKEAESLNKTLEENSIQVKHPKLIRKTKSNNKMSNKKMIDKDAINKKITGNTIKKKDQNNSNKTREYGMKIKDGNNNMKQDAQENKLTDGNQNNNDTIEDNIKNPDKQHMTLGQIIDTLNAIAKSLINNTENNIVPNLNKIELEKMADFDEYEQNYEDSNLEVNTEEEINSQVMTNILKNDYFLKWLANNTESYLDQVLMTLNKTIQSEMEQQIQKYINEYKNYNCNQTKEVNKNSKTIKDTINNRKENKLNDNTNTQLINLNDPFNGTRVMHMTTKKSLKTKKPNKKRKKTIIKMDLKPEEKMSDKPEINKLNKGKTIQTNATNVYGYAIGNDKVTNIFIFNMNGNAANDFDPFINASDSLFIYNNKGSRIGTIKHLAEIKNKIPILGRPVDPSIFNNIELTQDDDATENVIIKKHYKNRAPKAGIETGIETEDVKDKNNSTVHNKDGSDNRTDTKDVTGEKANEKLTDNNKDESKERDGTNDNKDGKDKKDEIKDADKKDEIKDADKKDEIKDADKKDVVENLEKEKVLGNNHVVINKDVINSNESTDNKETNDKKPNHNVVKEEESQDDKNVDETKINTVTTTEKNITPKEDAGDTNTDGDNKIIVMSSIEIDTSDETDTTKTKSELKQGETNDQDTNNKDQNGNIEENASTDRLDVEEQDKDAEEKSTPNDEDTKNPDQEQHKINVTDDDDYTEIDNFSTKESSLDTGNSTENSLSVDNSTSESGKKKKKMYKRKSDI